MAESFGYTTKILVTQASYMPEICIERDQVRIRTVGSNVINDQHIKFLEITKWMDDQGISYEVIKV